MSADAAPPGRSSAGAIVTAAVEATSALAGWLLEPGEGGLVVVAAHGGSTEWAASLVGRTVELDGATAALVVQSGQPVALQPGGTSLQDATALALLGRPPISLICVPCAAGDRVTGALQVVDRTDGGPFDFDSVELATLLGGIAGVVLDERPGADVATRAQPSPVRLAEDLARLAEVDPERYAAAAIVIEALLA
jgi:GAF domain-containing protein